MSVDEKPSLSHCTNYSPPWYRGRWRDWHRGHGCDLDDGQPRSIEAQAEIRSHEEQPK